MLLITGCEGTDSNLIRIELDQRNSDRLLALYFGGYVSDDGEDPFQAGLLHKAEDAYLLNVDLLKQIHPNLQMPTDLNGDGVLVWDELEPFLQATYYPVRNVPATLSDLRAEVPYVQDPSAWFQVEIDGVMTTARRHIFIRHSALRSALSGFLSSDRQLIYPTGTTIIGEHHLDGNLAEVTAMRKRKDGYWDFFTYDAAGYLTESTHTPPKSLKSPVQCIGCHLGTRLYEPEKSFPEQARPGPNGPRALYVDNALRNAEIMAFFDEHQKRSDGVLGLYNTLFVSQLLVQQRSGTLSDEDAEILKMLDLADLF